MLIFVKGHADRTPVNSQARVLKMLIDDSLYVVDERAVADAIVARMIVRLSVAESSLRNQQRETRFAPSGATPVPARTA
jgi:hypothetical protein